MARVEPVSTQPSARSDTACVGRGVISVRTTGAPESAELTAVWRFQTGQTVDSSSQTIAPQGEENTEFHVSNPKGWPQGTYSVTVYANGDSVDAKNFAVKK